MAKYLGGTPAECAVTLLGATVTSRIDGQRVSVCLTEVEAYGGRSDPASHAFGRRTARNDPILGPAGTLYFYLSYGIH
ncbi:MAG: 3-methyladenine DNA glycosylase, partial [Armatimonadetes bacterium]